MAWVHFTSITSTPIYNLPILYYGQLGANGPYQIPMRITGYNVSSETAKLNTIGGLPYFNKVSNNATGGFTLGAAPSELPKLTISGIMDTPATPTGSRELSTVFADGVRLSYGDIITAMLEGRANPGSPADNTAQHPMYFRDPFGRIYATPTITQFTAAYQEGVPFRQNFTMTILLTLGSGR